MAFSVSSYGTGSSENDRMPRRLRTVSRNASKRRSYSAGPTRSNCSGTERYLAASCRV